jgi:hypothetical protein
VIFTAEDVQSRLRNRPFTPLRIVTTTGQTYDVYHPDLVFVGRRSLEIGTPDRDNPTIFDMVTRVALVHVVELRDLPVPVAPPGAADAA